MLVVAGRGWWRSGQAEATHERCHSSGRAVGTTQADWRVCGTSRTCGGGQAVPDRVQHGVAHRTLATRRAACVRCGAVGGAAGRAAGRAGQCRLRRCHHVGSMVRAVYGPARRAAAVGRGGAGLSRPHAACRGAGTPGRRPFDLLAVVSTLAVPLGCGGQGRRVFAAKSHHRPALGGRVEGPPGAGLNPGTRGAGKAERFLLQPCRLGRLPLQPLDTFHQLVWAGRPTGRGGRGGRGL